MVFSTFFLWFFGFSKDVSRFHHGLFWGFRFSKVFYGFSTDLDDGLSSNL